MVFPINKKENSVVLLTQILKISGLLTQEYILEFDFKQTILVNYAENQ